MTQAKRFSLLAVAAAAMLIVGAARPAHAGPFSPGNVTFGQFAQVNNADQRFQFTNVTGGATFDSINVNNGGVAVNYTFSAFRTQPTGTFGATLTMTSSTTTTASTGANKLAIQPITGGVDGITNDIHIVSNEAIGTHPAGSVILDVTWDESTLSGTKLKHSASEVSSTSDVVFSSDFVDFSKTVQHAFALSFSSVNPPVAINTATGFLRNFTAAGTGTFSLTVTPEPASVALLMVGLAVCLIVARKQFAEVGTPA